MGGGSAVSVELKFYWVGLSRSQEGENWSQIQIEEGNYVAIGGTGVLEEDKRSETQTCLVCLKMEIINK